MGKDLNVNNFPVMKEGTQNLFAALTTSVTEPNTPSINMIGARCGSLDVTINSGSGTISFALYTSETGIAGSFKPTFTVPYGVANATPIQVPAIVTTASTSASYEILGLNSKYIKFVPNVSGTVNATVLFTPAVP